MRALRSDLHGTSRVSPILTVSLGLCLQGAVALATPHVDSIAPTTGIAGLDVTLTGSGFGASQGGGSVWLGDQPAAVVSWSDTEIVVTVAHAAASGVAKVSQGGWSNTVTFPVIEAKLVPETMSLVAGETRAMQVMNAETGAVVTDIPLTVSAPSVASVSTDNPLILAALDSGTATLSAGEATANLTVYEGPVLPTGTIRWTAPSDGSGFLATAQAIPSDNEDAVADVFTLQASGRVQALTAEGVLAWTRDLPSSVTRLLPDARGGVIAVDWPNLRRLDAATGETSWTFASEGFDAGTLAVRPNGTIVFVEHDIEEPFTASIVGLDPDTGGPLFSVPVENSVVDSSGGCEGGGSYVETAAQIAQLIVTANGRVFAPYVVETITSGGDCFAGGSTTVRALKLAIIDNSGNASTQTLHTWTGETGYEWNVLAETYYTTDSPAPGGSPLTIIAPEDDSVTLTWLGGGVPGHIPWCHGPFECGDWVEGTPDVQTITVADASGILSEVEIDGAFTVNGPMIAGEDGVLFTPVTMHEDWSPALAAIASNGSVLWTEAGQFQPIVATSSGGVIAREFGETEETVVLGDPNAPSYSGLGSGARYSWLGDWYSQVTIPNAGPAAASVAAPLVDVGTSAWSFEGGDPSGVKVGMFSVNSLMRYLFANVAEEYEGSENWLDDPQTHRSKCNLFVRSVLSIVGTSPPYETNFARRALYAVGRSPYWEYPALAGDWANKGTVWKCWRTLEEGPDFSLPGDVIAELRESDHASGHVGIVVGGESTASTNSFDPHPGTIRINDFGFRADDPSDELVGQKRHAVVKRFSCN